MIENYDEFFEAMNELEDVDDYEELSEWVNDYEADDNKYFEKVKSILLNWIEEQEENVNDRVADGLELDTTKTMPDGCSEMDYELDRLREQAYTDAYNWQHKKRRKK